MTHAPTPHRARKRFGQNFLRDTGIIDRLVRAIHPVEGDRLVEIGPGQGAITQGLLDGAQALDVIELDRDLVPGLRTQFFNYPEFRIHQADALGSSRPAIRHLPGIRNTCVMPVAWKMSS